MPFTFYLGVDARFLQHARVPLFISRRTLERYTHPCSYTTWALDSGAFTELSTYGRWVTTPGAYAAQARWWYDHVSGMRWAAIQDWMCEPLILAKTGLTVVEHQHRTVESYLCLRALQPSIPWVPVLQGYAPAEYVDHLRQYEESGVDLRALSLVGVGSVCRRQSTDVDEAVVILKELHGAGLRLHAFGFKATGLARCAHLLASADSMAWASRGWHVTKEMHRRAGVRRCAHARNPAHCLDCALEWRQGVLDAVARNSVVEAS
jgi:hypothetical protein